MNTAPFFDLLSRKISLSSDRSILYHDDAFIDELDRRVAGFLESNHVLSLDIFDTFLLRSNESEIRRFTSVSQSVSRFVESEYGRVIAWVDVFLARYKGTLVTYRSRDRFNGQGEGSLTEIYEVAAVMLDLPNTDADIEALVNVELQVEKEHLRVSNYWLSTVTRHVGSGGVCILISDMYMHVEQLKRLLISLGVELSLFEAIYSSADFLASKASGGIFSCVEADLNLNHDHFFHCGDSFKGDFYKPRKAGWDALHIPIPDAELYLRAKDHRVTVQEIEDNYKFVVGMNEPKFERLAGVIPNEQ